MYRGYLGAALAGERGNAVVETPHGDRALGAVQARHDLAEHVQRVGDRAAEPAGVQVGAGSLDGYVHRDQALGRDRHRWLAGPPHRPVRGYHEVGGQIPRVIADARRQVRAADLLLALEQELHIQRKRALLGEKGQRGAEDDVHRPLVVGRAAPADDVADAGELERRRVPFGQVTGRLHVVMPVDEYGRRPGGSEPLAGDDGVAAGRQDPAPSKGQLPGQPVGGGAHGRRAGVPAHARYCDKLGKLAQVARLVGVKGEHRHRRSRWSAR
jgi:hypothetical protein